jgi:hypothetical protein
MAVDDARRHLWGRHARSLGSFSTLPLDHLAGVPGVATARTEASHPGGETCEAAICLPGPSSFSII